MQRINLAQRLLVTAGAVTVTSSGAGLTIRLDSPDDYYQLGSFVFLYYGLLDSASPKGYEFWYSHGYAEVLDYPGIHLTYSRGLNSGVEYNLLVGDYK